GLTVEQRPGNPDRCEVARHDREAAGELRLEIAIVESLVPIEAVRSVRPGAHRGDARNARAQHTANHLERRVAFAMLVIAQPAQTGERTEELLAGQTRTYLNRHADDQYPIRGEQLSERVNDATSLILQAVLEHLHTGNDVPRVRRATLDVVRQSELHSW